MLTRAREFPRYPIGRLEQEVVPHVWGERETRSWERPAELLTERTELGVEFAGKDGDWYRYAVELGPQVRHFTESGGAQGAREPAWIVTKALRTPLGSERRWEARLSDKERLRLPSVHEARDPARFEQRAPACVGLSA